MIVRSQNKKFIYNFNNLEAIFVSSYGTGGYCVMIGVNQNSNVIGEYSTEEKAIKVLDMIQEAYLRNSVLDMNKSFLEHLMPRKIVFQMPQDSEV